MPLKDGGGGNPQPYDEKTGKYTKFQNFARPSAEKKKFNPEDKKTIDEFKNDTSEGEEHLKKWQNGKANKDTFFYETNATFEKAEKPNREPDYVSKDYNGNISSQYWYTDDGVYRRSNHWGSGVASCNWYLGNQKLGSDMNVTSNAKVGFCKWEDFYHTPKVINVVDEKGNKKQTISSFANRPDKDTLIVDGETYKTHPNENGTLVWTSEKAIKDKEKKEQAEKEKTEQTKKSDIKEVQDKSKEFLKNPKEFSEKNGISYKEFVSKKSGKDIVEINNIQIPKEKLNEKKFDGSTPLENALIKALGLKNPYSSF